MEPEKRWLLLFPAVLIYSRRHRFVDEANQLSGHPAMACAGRLGPPVTRCGSRVGQNAVMHNTAFRRCGRV
jgi:hypothetical protein